MSFSSLKNYKKNALPNYSLDKCNIQSSISFEIENALDNATFVEKYQDEFNYDQQKYPVIKEHDIIYHSALTSQRDSLANVLVMEAATTRSLVLASRRGLVTLVSGSSLSQSVGPAYQLPVTPGGQKVVRSHGCSWLCDAAVMADAKTVVFALSDRSLQFYDTACSLRSDTVQEHRHLWRVVGLTHSVTCLVYDEASSQLFLGDEQGSVTSLSFLQPLTVLFQRRGLEARPGQAESVYWPEILKQGGPHCNHVAVRVDKKVHSEAVLQMTYCPEQQTIISCSLDVKRSLVLRHRTGKMPASTFSLDEGARCFAFNARRHQLATGSDDGMVRLWNPLVASRAVACLAGHEAPVVDVLFAADLVISLCRFAVSLFNCLNVGNELRIWNTRLHLCVQCVALPLPLTRHWAGTHSLYLWQDSGVLVALGSRLAEIPLVVITPRESSSSCSLQSDPESSSSLVNKPLWQDQQVKSLVERAHELNVELSGLTSEVPSTIPSPHEDDFLLYPTIPELNLNLDAFPKTTFKRPQFPPSALEVINFRDDPQTDVPPGMNERIEIQERVLGGRRQLVEQCAPHLALTLWPPSIIALPCRADTLNK